MSTRWPDVAGCGHCQGIVIGQGVSCVNIPAVTNSWLRRRWCGLLTCTELVIFLRTYEMKKLIAALCLTLAVSPLALAETKAAAASAPTQLAQAKQEPSAKQKAQQQKMKDCNKDAKKNKLKGDDRKKFMKTCLSAKK